MIRGISLALLLGGALLLAATTQALDRNPTSAEEAQAAAAPPSPALDAFRAAIRAKYDMKEKAFAAHDAETIVSRFYTADVISVGEGEGIFVGRDQIRPLYQEVVQHSTVKITSVYTHVNGDAGWDWADFEVTPDQPEQKPFTFAILFLWTRMDGDWMCKGDVFLFGSFRSGQLTRPPAAQ